MNIVMGSNNFYDQWVSFCKHAVPGARYWLNDALFERLWVALEQEQRYFSEPPPWKIAITYRGGYEHGGLTFYAKSSYPYPLRRTSGLQEFCAR